MGTFFWEIFKIIKRFRFVSLLVLVAIMLFFGFGISKIHLEEDISEVLLSNKETETVNKLMEDIDFSNKIVLVVSQSDTSLAPQYDSLIATANKFIEFLSPADSLIGTLSFGVENEIVDLTYDVFYRNLPLFLEEEDYKTIEKKLNNESIENTIEGNFKALMTPAGMGMRSFILKDPLHFTPIVLLKLKNLQLGDSYKLYKNQIFSGNGYHLFFFIETAFGTSDTGKNSLLVENIQKAKSAVDNTFNTVDYYGAPVVTVCNANQVKRDIFLTVGLALVLLVLVISLLFQSGRIFMLVFLPVVFGLIVSLGSFYWFHGTISAIALGVGSILMGITIDYTIHLFVNYRSTKSIKVTLSSISLPLIISSITTAIAFLCLYFVDSPALRELGIFATISILSAALFVLIVTPQFLKEKLSVKETKSIRTLNKFVSIEFDKIKYLQWGIVIFTLLSIYPATRVIFNTDLEALNYQSPYLKKTEEKLKTISSEAFRSVFFIAQGNTFDEALATLETQTSQIDSLKNEGIIQNILTVSSILKSKGEQQIRLDRWNSFWTNERKTNCIENVKSAGEKNQFKPGTFNEFENLLNNNFTLLSAADQDFIVNNFFESLVKKKADKVYLLSTLKVDQSEKEMLYSVLGKSKNAMLWDKQHFSVKLVDALKNDFNQLVWISLFAVFAVLLISYGRIELAILAMIPLIVGWLWTLGIMGLFGIEFNIFNIIISTFIFGLGVDYAVFILNALIEERKFGHNELTASKLSILLSALTTFAGIGVLIFAKHPALKSIAALSIIGVGSILFLSYTLLPVCYRFLYFNNGKDRTAPVTLYNLFTSVFAFVQFLTGCATLTGLIPVLLILPVRLKTKKYILHRLLQFLSFFIVYSIFGIKKKMIDRKKFDLSTPKIIVSNHQSHLDLTLILLLNPKIIVLTNDWVWNNPFYGFIVRFLDYHPISKGMEEIVDPLQKCVNDGYSILVFPEGHRTHDGKISRFHNGAVFLSEKLKLDILPVLIHGANHCMDRNEFFIRNGQVTIKFLDPIKKENFLEKETYISRSNELLKFFRNEFHDLSQKLETPDYFSSRLIQSYIYKGPVLEWYLRVKIRLEHNYNFFNNTISRDAVICDIGCGYGFMSAMLKLVAPERQIFAIDYDAQKVELAKQAHLNKEGLNFISGDILNVEIPKADAIILADVLHYMPEKQQESCIKKCMASLNENGQIIIRDADTDLAKRTKGTKLTEFFSTRLLGFNKTEYEKLYFFSGKKIEQLALSNGFSYTRIDKTKLTSNMIYVLQRKDKI